MKIIIISSKDIKYTYKLIDDSIWFSRHIIKNIDKIVCLDKFVEKWAKDRKYKTKFFPILWTKLDIEPEKCIIKEKDGSRFNILASRNRDELATKYAQGLICIYKRNIVNGEFVDDKNMDRIIEKMKELGKKISVMEM